MQNRVHAEVLRLARTAEVRGNAARISPEPRHAEIASRVSTSREQVTRELSRVKRQGLIAGDARTLVVPDIARLERLVDEVRR